jgi:hypothetical protein
MIVYELWQVLDLNDLYCMLCIFPQTAQSVICCHFHRPVHPISTTVCGHAHSYYGTQSQKISLIFFRRMFHHGISIASKNLFYAYSSEYMSLSLFL